MIFIADTMRCLVELHLHQSVLKPVPFSLDAILLQFRALADQIFRNPDYHKHVRKLVMKQVDFLPQSCTVMNMQLC